MKGLDVGAIMKLKELFDSGGRARTEIVVIEPAEKPGEIRNGGMTNKIQWMISTERRAAVDLAADKNRCRQRGVSVDRGHCLVILHVFMIECGNSLRLRVRGNIPFN